MFIRLIVAVSLLLSQLAIAQQMEGLEGIIERLGSLDREAGVPEKVHLTPGGTVVEFFNFNLKHYFRTAEAAEVSAVMDGAAGPGWVRTGDDFHAWVSSSGFIPTDGLPVCRFYAPGPNSHFYTINAGECAQVKLDPGWHYEGMSYYAFPVPISGICPLDYSPVYRAYNNRFQFNDSNHRFTTNSGTYQQMIGQGWIGEGVVMCAPLPTTLDQQRTEQLIGGTWVISYRYGSSNYTDHLTYTGLYQSPSSGQIYAQGTNQFGLITLGQYTPGLSTWLIVSAYSSSSVYPADAYSVTISGNTMTGCYYFLLSASSPLGSCTPLGGVRN